jgi:Flp pilus assembly protein TadG
MTAIRVRWERLRDLRGRDAGYVAVMTAFLMITLTGLAAFAVDVGNWYLVGQQEQRAVDAAVMAGVTYLPGDATKAISTAQTYSKINGFQDATSATTVIAAIDGRPTRLRVTSSRVVTNFFGSLLGVATTTVGRTAVADFAGPVPMGSPCNTFGNDPDPAGNRATTCSGVLGAFWANINSKGASKINGDAYQGNVCDATVDGCSSSSSGPNTDYATDGYYYTVSVKTPGMSSVTVELFDPVFVHTGLTCPDSGNPDVFDENGDKAVDARNDLVTNESTRYAPGASSAWCTGDALLGSLNSSLVMNTQFTVRDPGTNSWDVSTFPVHTGCQKTYPGYYGKLYQLLNKGSTSTYNENNSGVVSSPADTSLVNGFRRWTTLCTISNPVVGDYLIQVKANGLSTALDAANASNHFAMRAYGSVSGDKENLSISGREKMGIYANAPGATTEFYLARVPSSAAGQTLKVRLFDVGDSSGTGTIKMISPPDATGGVFTGCVGTLSTGSAVALTNCSLTVTNATHNGKWQAISVPIPAAYSCTDSDMTKCWVRLQYSYGSGNQPNDVTSWTASIEGDPVRLVE